MKDSKKNITTDRNINTWKKQATVKKNLKIF